MKYDNAVNYLGIDIVSRYNMPVEIARMKRAADNIPEHLRSEVIHIHCDSKVGECYNIQLRSKKHVDEIVASICSRLGWEDVGFDLGDERVYDSRGWVTPRS